MHKMIKIVLLIMQISRNLIILMQKIKYDHKLFTKFSHQEVSSFSPSLWSGLALTKAC